MLFQVLSISSILLGIYLILTLFLKNPNDHSFDYQTDFHLGCFNQHNAIDHSQHLEAFLNKIQTNNNNLQIQQLNNSLATHIDFNKESKEVAKNFQAFLNEYYKVKTKSDFDQNFYNSLQIAKNEATECELLIQDLFEE